MGFRPLILMAGLVSMPLPAAGVPSGPDCLKVGLNNLPPFVFPGPDGRLQGIHVDYIRQLEKRTGLCFTIRSVPFARSLRGMETGQFDAAVFFKGKKRAHFARPAARFLSGAFHMVMPRSGLVLKTKGDLRGKKVGTLRRGAVLAKVSKIPGVRIFKANDYYTMFRMLGRGRTDAVAGNTLNFAWEMRSPEIRGKADPAGALNLGVKEQWFHFSLKSPHLDKAEKVRQASDALVQEGQVRKIVDRYLGTGWENLLAH